MQEQDSLKGHYSEVIKSYSSSVVDDFIELVDEDNISPLEKTRILHSLVITSKSLSLISPDISGRAGDYNPYLSDSYDKFTKDGEVYKSRILLINCEDGIDMIYVCLFRGDDIDLKEENIRLGIVRKGKEEVVLKKGIPISDGDTDADKVKTEVSKATAELRKLKKIRQSNGTYSFVDKRGIVVLRGF